jgi:hypothetical protein
MRLHELTQLLPFINTLLIAGLMTGTIIAMRSGSHYRHRRNRALARMLTALRSEIATIKEQTMCLDASNRHLSSVIDTLSAALHQTDKAAFVEEIVSKQERGEEMDPAS